MLNIRWEISVLYSLQKIFDLFFVVFWLPNEMYETFPANLLHILRFTEYLLSLKAPHNFCHCWMLCVGCDHLKMHKIVYKSNTLRFMVVMPNSSESDSFFDFKFDSQVSSIRFNFYPNSLVLGGIYDCLSILPCYAVAFYYWICRLMQANKNSSTNKVNIVKIANTLHWYNIFFT